MQTTLKTDDKGLVPKGIVEFHASDGFASFLAQQNIALLVSTYQAGQLVTLGTESGKLIVEFESFDRPMGLAFGNGKLVVATRKQIWILPVNESIAPEMEPANRYEKVFLARQSFYTGDVQAHEIGWGASNLIFVNTAFSCISTVHDEFSFVPLWRPPFVSDLVAEDRCHLNGMALVNGEPMYATALAATNTPAGWRPVKAAGGLILSLPDGNPVATQLCMPHSPRVHAGELWVLNSGLGQLLKVEVESGHLEVVEVLPGYTRGLACLGEYAIVGLSKIRETAVFGELPLSEHHDQLRCGLAVVHLPTGRTLATFQFTQGIEEVFDICIIPNTRAALVVGPNAGEERTIWLAPQQHVDAK